MTEQKNVTGQKSPAEQKIKKFRLSFVNAAEDIPRLARAYGKLSGGVEAAVVLRLTERSGLLVRIETDGTARIWTSEDSGADAPNRPKTTIDVQDAVARVKAFQRGLSKAGPITLRGQWSGYFYCDEGTPRVELSRKVAPYGLLRIVSDPAKGWIWRVERTEKWFSQRGQDEGRAGSVVEAIRQGLARAMGLLGEACSMRDSRRRAAYDSSYAEAHPIKPAAETKDPTERLKPKKGERKEARPKKGERKEGMPKEGEAKEGEPREGEAKEGKPREGRQKRKRRNAGKPSEKEQATGATPADKADDTSAPESPSASRRGGKTSSRSKPAATSAAERASAGETSLDDLTPDPEKDRLLLNMFSEAVAAAVHGGKA